jgi:hypothetical protein
MPAPEAEHRAKERTTDHPPELRVVINPSPSIVKPTLMLLNFRHNIKSEKVLTDEYEAFDIRGVFNKDTSSLALCTFAEDGRAVSSVVVSITRKSLLS